MYYIMESPVITTEAGEACLEIHNTFRIAGIRLWQNNKPLTPEQKNNIPNPIEIEFDVFRGYNGLPNEFEDLGIPIMSDRLYKTLISAGVDNLETFPAVLKNKATGERYAYHAYKIYGLISLMDESQSEFETYKNSKPVIGTTIHKFVADESKAHGLLLFRMAEDATAIVVHESVKKRIEEAGIDSVEFIKPEDYTSI